MKSKVTLVQFVMIGSVLYFYGGLIWLYFFVIYFFNLLGDALTSNWCAYYILYSYDLISGDLNRGHSSPSEVQEPNAECMGLNL